MDNPETGSIEHKKENEVIEKNTTHTTQKNKTMNNHVITKVIAKGRQFLFIL
jgi:hypothetical protein